MIARSLAVPALFVVGVLVTMLVVRVPPPAHAARNPAGAAVTAQDSTRAMPAALLRRLAEAADGYRTGAPVWVVASYERPYTVVGVYPSQEQAFRVARERGKLFEVFGPYVTPLDYGRLPLVMAKTHCWPTIYNCLEWQLPEAPWFAEDVDSMTITIFHRSGQTWRKTSPGLGVDAVFFTLSAIDKFVVPYYTQLYGPEYAKSMRDSLGAYIQLAPERHPSNR